MKSALCLIATLLLSSILYSQDHNSIELQNCDLSIEVPLRLIEISSNEKEIIYRDKLSNSILTFNKAGTEEYEIDIEYTAQRVWSELSDDPHYKEVRIRETEMQYADVYLIDWNLDPERTRKRNNCFTMAIMEVCEQYYTFTYQLPKEHKPDAAIILDTILSSIFKEEKSNLEEASEVR